MRQEFLAVLSTADATIHSSSVASIPIISASRRSQLNFPSPKQKLQAKA